MIENILLLIVGFIILIKGADIFVDGASAVATNFKLPKILIGLTIVAFGTSAPEFAVSISSILSNNHDIVLGNVIGSNILNILLILGVSSLFNPLVVKSNTVKKEIPIMILMTCLFAVLLSDSIFDSNVVNSFTRSDGIILFLFFLIFIYYLISMSLSNGKSIIVDKKRMSLFKAFIYTILGIVMIFFGSRFVVSSSSVIAAILGVSEKMIALTIIALGTSLPELVTSVVASRKNECDLAIGNVVGSCIFNMGIVVALPVSIFGGITNVNFGGLDLAIMLFSVILLFFFSLNDRKLTKREGFIFLMIFLIYYSFVIING